MKALAVLPVLALAFACADTGVVQPEPEAFQDAVAFDQANMPGAMEFTVEVRFVGTLEPGETRVTPSGVIHNKGVVNEWAMVGDMVGPWYFAGGYQVNAKTGMGRSIGNPVGFEVESSKWGMTGMFECNNSFKIENWPTDDFIQYGHLSGCHGTGDFTGMHLKAYMTNVDNPGLGGPETIYDLTGVIW